MNKELWEKEVYRFSEEFEDPSPFDNDLDAQICGCSFEEQRISFRFTPQSWMKNERMGLHGGIISCVFDSALGKAAIFATDRGEVTTMDLAVSYLRPAEIEDELIVHTYIVKVGRNLIRMRGEMVFEESGKLVATAQGNWFPLK